MINWDILQRMQFLHGALDLKYKDFTCGNVAQRHGYIVIVLLYNQYIIVHNFNLPILCRRQMRLENMPHLPLYSFSYRFG